jgi:hypothetical protein
MKPGWQLRFLCSAVLVCLPLAAPASSDPVTDFIVRADSLANAGGDELLAPYVASHKVIVGAVVGQLLDVAFDLGEAGDTASEGENVAFAERLARLHLASAGSRIPLELVEIYRSWTPGQRSARAKAKALEAKAFELQNGGEYDGAAELFAQVIELSQSIDDRRLIAVTWGSLGVVNWYRRAPRGRGSDSRR